MARLEIWRLYKDVDFFRMANGLQFFAARAASRLGSAPIVFSGRDERGLSKMDLVHGLADTSNSLAVYSRHRRGKSRTRGRSEQSTVRIAPISSSAAHSAIAPSNAAALISGISGSPRSRITLGFESAVCARILGKSRSLVTSTKPRSRAYAQIAESVAPMGPAPDQ